MVFGGKSQQRDTCLSDFLDFILVQTASVV
jgi:hypothetical protein